MTTVTLNSRWSSTIACCLYAARYILFKNVWTLGRRNIDVVKFFFDHTLCSVCGYRFCWKIWLCVLLRRITSLHRVFTKNFPDVSFKGKLLEGTEFESTILSLPAVAFHALFLPCYNKRVKNWSIFSSMLYFFSILLDIIFSISTAKNTSEEAAPTKMNSFSVNASVLKMGCKNGV